MLKAVFFDNDGVLVETEYLYFLATREVFERKGIILTEEIYVEYFLRQGIGTWFLLKENGCSPEEIENLRRERNQIYLGLQLDKAYRIKKNLAEAVDEILKEV